jgi:transcriptional regulator with XRE-family HTH domain
LGDLVTLRGLGTLAISSHRKWCPECLNEDLETELGPYDRLLWSIDDVHACPIHNVQLRSTCQSCGSGPFAISTGRDISGRCPKRFGWLGGESTTLDQTRDDYSRYLLWIAKSYSDLLDSYLPSKINIGPGFRTIVIALTERHFNGVVAQFSSAIERNRSVVTTWLLDRASPSWRALCEISFVFQIPLLELLTGQTNAVELSTVQRMPLAALKRLTRPRKLPEKRDLNDIKSFLAKVERGELPNVLTMKSVGNRIGIHPRELSRIVPEDAARLSILLAKRRVQIREKKKTRREQVLREEVPAAVLRLLNEGIRPSRRAVDKSLAFAGIPVRRQEAPFVRELVQLTLGDKISQ